MGVRAWYSAESRDATSRLFPASIIRGRIDQLAMPCRYSLRDAAMNRLLPLIVLPAFAMPARAEEAVSFRHEVMAVLSRAGCNMGACHGNQNGKNGFRLSLRGQDPAFDFDALTRELSGRRIDLLTPEKSLILQKPTGQLAHQGGVRFRPDSLE